MTINSFYVSQEQYTSNYRTTQHKNAKLELTQYLHVYKKSEIWSTIYHFKKRKLLKDDD
ncbi:hypothetical protein J6590_071754 [Homalodisca vitripennis]|nr:hypothetical protein J6590_071754 [Homalodisca vitripennis]